MGIKSSKQRCQPPAYEAINTMVHMATENRIEDKAANVSNKTVIQFASQNTPQDPKLNELYDKQMFNINNVILTEEPVTLDQVHKVRTDFNSQQYNAYAEEYKRQCIKQICEINEKLKPINRYIYIEVKLYAKQIFTIPDKYISPPLNRQLMYAVWYFITESYKEFEIKDIYMDPDCVRAKIYKPIHCKFGPL